MTDQTQLPEMIQKSETVIVNPAPVNEALNSSDHDDSFVLEEVLEQKTDHQEKETEKPAESVQEEKTAKKEEADSLEKLMSEFEDNYNLPDQEKKATQSYATSTSEKVGSPDTVFIPPSAHRDAEKLINRLPSAFNYTMSERQLKWVQSLQYSFSGNSSLGDVYSDRVNENGSDFKQHVEYNGNTYRGRAPVFKRKPGSREIDGENALIQLVTHLGIGGLFRAPLWNTGMWVTFKPATETELLELNRLLHMDKIRMGRLSHGLALSNYVVYSVERVFDFALQHVYNTSIRSEELPLNNLRDWISPQDINSFIWGFLCANYPSGFHYMTGCVSNPVKCNHVIEETLNVTKLQWVDNSDLTDWQKQHMSSMAANSKSLDSLKRYKEEMKRVQSRRIILHEGTKHELAITVKTPTVTEYIQQGHNWIGGIIESVNAALGYDANDNARSEYVNTVGKATTLCQYSHWIESVEYGEITEKPESGEEASRNIITDRNTIDETLKLLSSTDSIREKIIDEIIKYINDSTISVIGVPSFDCPACGQSQDLEMTYPRHTSIIPLDVLNVFFDLISQRVTRIGSRER